MKNWYKSKIQRGDQTGSKYVYPTINLDPKVLPVEAERGVYASVVKLGKATYQGALYYGPRLVKDEQHDVLEIYLLNFTGPVVVPMASFTLNAYIRNVRNFPTLTELRHQVKKDILAVRKALREK